MFSGLISRQHSRIIWLALAVFLTSLAILYAKNQQRLLFIQSQNLTRQTNALETEWGQLLLEQSTWSMQARVERVATQQLNMVMPAPKSIIMVKQ